jgi:hypothetical protein
MSDSLNPGSADNTLEHYLFFDNGRIGFPVYETRGVSVVSSNGVVWPDAAGVASGRPYHSVLNIKLSSGTSETATSPSGAAVPSPSLFPRAPSGPRW